MNKTDLINAVATKAGITKKDSEKAINTMTAVITDALNSGDKVRLQGFGTFDVKERAARMGCNPRTKEQISIPPSKVPVFRPSSVFRENIL